MAKDLAIVLNNGSINSAVVTAMAAQRYRPIIVFADTTAAPADRVRAAVEAQIAHFKPYRDYSIPIPLSTGPAPQALAAVVDPRLNAALAPQLLDLLPLIAVAVRLAANHQAAGVYIGSRVGPHVDDLAQATEFFQIWSEMVQIPCGQSDLEILAPLLELEPWQVVDLGFQVGAPFEKTWSCLEESSDPCWSCRGCRAREVAFQQAAKADPLKIARKV